MNTNRTGMRTVLAAAAAGALIMGSAAGAMADDVPAPAVDPAPVVKIQKVDIHRHSPINVTKARDLKVRMTVRTPLVATPGVTPEITDAVVTLSQFAKKSSQMAVADPAIAPLSILDWTITHNTDKSVWYLKGSVPAAILAGLATDLDGEGTEDTIELAAGKSALLCISAADTIAPQNAWSKQTLKRLGTDVKKPVRECVKLYNPKVKPSKPAKS